MYSYLNGSVHAKVVRVSKAFRLIKTTYFKKYNAVQCNTKQFDNNRQRVTYIQWQYFEKNHITQIHLEAHKTYAFVTSVLVACFILLICCLTSLLKIIPILINIALMCSFR